MSTAEAKEREQQFCVTPINAFFTAQANSSEPIIGPALCAVACINNNLLFPIQTAMEIRRRFRFVQKLFMELRNGKS